MTIFSDKKSVKIYVLYLMDNINYPLDYPTINDMIMQNEFVDYLDFAECFAEMLDDLLILKVELEGVEHYYVSERGRTVARELSGDILPSVLDDSLANALRLIDFNKRGIKCASSVEKCEDERYLFRCSMRERGREILDLTLVLDSPARAKRMKETFSGHPDVIYRGIHALLSGDAQFLFD